MFMDETYMHYYKMWVQFTSPLSLLLHWSPFITTSEIIWCTWTPFVVMMFGKMTEVLVKFNSLTNYKNWPFFHIMMDVGYRTLTSSCPFVLEMWLLNLRMF
jgi:hypothetical protein